MALRAADVEQSAATERERIFTLPFVTLLVSNGLLRMCTYMLITIVPLYALHRGASPAGAGLTTTLYMGAAVVTRPWAGRLVDKHSRWLIILAGSSIFCAAAGFYLIALPMWLFLADRALQGVGFSLNGTAVMTLATDIIPEKRMAQGISYLGIEQTVAQIFAPWFVLEVLSLYGYMPAFTVVFALSVVNLLVRFPLARTARRLEAERKERLRAQPAAVAEPQKRPTGTRRLSWDRLVERGAWRPALVMFLVMLGTTTINTFLAAYAIHRGIANSGLFFICSGVALAASRLGVPLLSRRMGQARLIPPAMVFIVAGLLLVSWTPNILVLGCAGLCYGLGTGVVTPGLNALAVLAAEKSARGLANSTFFMAMDLANAIGAPTLGLVAVFTGLGTVFVISGGLVFLALATFLVMRRRGVLAAA